jgi:hypothetical protein
MATTRQRKPRGPSKGIVMNRAAVDAIVLGYADGLHEVGVRILARAKPNVPDRPPFGRGLVESGSVVTMVRRKRVATTGPTSRLPRDGLPPGDGVATIVGYAFPGRFVFLGTQHSAPQDPLTPAMGAELGGHAQVVAQKIKEHLAKVRR